MQIIHHLQIDLVRRMPAPPVSTVQNDANARHVAIELLENGSPWEVPANVVAAVAFKKSDGHKGLYDHLPDGTQAVTIDGNTVTAILAPQVLTCVGEVETAVILQSTDQDQLTTFPFKIRVEANPGAEQPISNDYYVGGLPVVTAEDNDKILQVVGGKWKAVESYSSEIIAQMQQDIADLKYDPIDITQITDNVVTMEKGSVVNEVTVSWTLNKDPVSQTLDGEAVDVAARSKTIPGPFSADKSFMLSVTDERGATDSASTAITFLRGVYYGALNVGVAIDSAAINGMGRSLQSSIAGTFKMTATEGQKLTFAAPVSYGEPTKFTSGGLDYTWDKVATFEHENKSGHKENYNVWQNSEVTVGTFSVTVVK